MGNTELELRVYYHEIFPLDLLWRILEITEKREVSFFTDTGTYLRYLVFETPQMFREKLTQVNPMKIDLGPSYNIRPTKSNGALPVTRELVFDIDLTDYPRECCQEKKVCKICYEKIKAAVKILDYSLRYEFGFRNYGFVFSGRRGVHCWVLEMKDMTQRVRNDIFKFFQTVIDKNRTVLEYNRILQEFGEVDLVTNFFPRIDKQVTVSMNHLIKMPFSVHPETLNISVPLDPERITELEDIPTLSEVVANPDILQPYIEVLSSWKR